MIVDDHEDLGHATQVTLFRLINSSVAKLVLTDPEVVHPRNKFSNLEAITPRNSNPAKGRKRLGYPFTVSKLAIEIVVALGMCVVSQSRIPQRSSLV